MKRGIVIDWLGLPYGIISDIYIFQKLLGCEIIWISCHNENRQYVKEKFTYAYDNYLKEYDELYFIETEFFCFLNDGQKKEGQLIYFMKNIDINPIIDYETYYKKLHLVDVTIARTNVTKRYYETLKQQYGYTFKILYTKFTSIDYSKYYCKRRHFYVENPFMGQECVIIQKDDFLIEEIPYSIHIENEYSFLSFGRNNLNIIIDFWNRHKEQLPKIYIKTYNNLNAHTKQQCVENKKIILIDTFIEEKEKMRLYNKCIFFINVSFQEGYGHNINEARSSGRVILVLNKEPMNELIDNDSGIVMENIEEGIKKALSLSKEQIQYKQELIKRKYLEDTQFLSETLRNNI